jgi:hypothetical protein
MIGFRSIAVDADHTLPEPGALDESADDVRCKIPAMWGTASSEVLCDSTASTGFPIDQRALGRWKSRAVGGPRPPLTTELSPDHVRLCSQAEWRFGALPSV